MSVTIYSQRFFVLLHQGSCGGNQYNITGWPHPTKTKFHVQYTFNFSPVFFSPRLLHSLFVPTQNLLRKPKQCSYISPQLSYIVNDCIPKDAEGNHPNVFILFVSSHCPCPIPLVPGTSRRPVFVLIFLQIPCVFPVWKIEVCPCVTACSHWPRPRPRNGSDPRNLPRKMGSVAICWKWHTGPRTRPIFPLIQLGTVPIFLERHFIGSERNINPGQCEHTVSSRTYLFSRNAQHTCGSADWTGQ